MAIGLSHGGTNVYSAGERSRQLWVGTQDGLALFERGNDGWRETQRALRGQHISSIIFERTTGTMFAGAFFGSVHASSDGGKTWERRDNGMPIHDVYSLARTRRRRQSARLCRNPTGAFVRQRRLGQHWSEIALAARSTDAFHSGRSPRRRISPTRNSLPSIPTMRKRIYACVEQGAFLKSTDEGKSWAELNTVGLCTRTRTGRWNIFTTCTAV